MRLLENPFHVLGASPRDDRRRLLELAEERSLSQDPAVCAQARADLTNPRNRLVAEVAWLPGLDPVHAGAAMGALRHAAAALLKVESLPALAKANLLAAALPGMDDLQSLGELPTAILELAALQEACDAERVRALINEERAVAGFPEVRETSAVAEALAERRRYYRTALKEALEVLRPLKLVRVVTLVVLEATARGTRPAPALIDDLVDTYEVEAQRFLEAEARNVELLVQGLRQGVEKKRSREILQRLLSRIQEVVLNWDRVALPIQLSAMSRGRDHLASQEVAGHVRELAVELYNDHGMLEESRFLTNLLRDAFVEVPRVAEKVGEDSRALEEIARKREADKLEWVREIAYVGLVGTSVKTLLQISPQGIDWQGTLWPLESITRIMWGGVRAPEGEDTQYLITFGNAEVSTTVTTHDERLLTLLAQKLWVAVGKRLLLELLNGLGKGKSFAFGDAMVDDNGIELVRQTQQRPFPQWGFQYPYPGESGLRVVRVPWAFLHFESVNGTLCLRHKQDPSLSVELPYMSVANVHVLKVALQMLFEMKSPVLMSDLLRK